MRWNQFLVMSLAATISVFAATAHQAQGGDARKKVAISQAADHAALDATRKGILDQLEESGFRAGESVDVIYENAQGSMATAVQISQRLASFNPNVVVAIATLSAQTAVASVKTVPIVFATVTDPLGAKLVKSLEQPDGAVTGVSNAVSFEPQLQLMLEILPSLKKIGVVYNPGEANSVVLLARMKEVSARHGIEIIESAASKTSEVAGATQAIANKVDAIFINNDNTALAAFESVVNAATRTKKPVFASDTECVDRGAIAVLGPNQYQVGRQAGRMVVQVLNGIPTRLIPVGFPEDMELHVNKQMADRLGIVIQPEVLHRAQSVK